MVQNKTRPAHATLQFLVGRVHRHLKRGNRADAPVYLAAVMEYLAAEILELAGNAAKDNNLRHIKLALWNDQEFNKLLSCVTMAQGSFLQNIQAVLCLRRGKKNNS